MGKTDTPRPRQVSQEELDLRWALIRREVNLTDRDFVERVREIRKRTGKP